MNNTEMIFAVAIFFNINLFIFIVGDYLLRLYAIKQKVKLHERSQKIKRTRAVDDSSSEKSHQ